MFYKIIDNTVHFFDKKIDGDCKEYTETNGVYSPDEINQVIDLKKNINLINSLVFNNKQYLSDTDWYYVRKIERNIDVPLDVVAKRAEAIKFIQDNEEVANV